MCACGEVSPSFVCAAHRGTRHDPAWWEQPDPETPEEREWREAALFWMAQMNPLHGGVK